MGESTVKDTVRKGGLKALAKRIKDAENYSITVGIQGAEASTTEGNLTVAELGAIHEFGLGNNPVRSWLRAWFDGAEEGIREDMRKGMRQVIAGAITKVQLANALGIRMVAQIQTRWTQPGVFLPNKPETIKRKESSAPLIDTGVLRSSVTYKVEPISTLAGGVKE